MMQIIDTSEVRDFTVFLREDNAKNEAVEAAVEEILANVRQNGDAALREYSNRFDGALIDDFLVSEAEINAAWDSVDDYFKETLRQARNNIAEFHKLQKPNDAVLTKPDGVVLGQRFLPVDRAGVYVPGGTAAYPSTVLMDVIPAVIAGVGEIIMVTPPKKDGSIDPHILTAARIAGVNKVYKVGGAQAIGALAYGTESIPRVDVIVGPGNIYVATAKRMVYGRVNIDMIAGPSEILVIASPDCDPRHTAADLLSQAEHDRLASAVLITTDASFAQKVAEEVEKQLSVLPREAIARESIETRGRVFIVDDLDKAVELSNAIAPEHLELSVSDPFGLLPKVKHAGSVFLGKHVPEALGDYFAGPNHTLPTSGTARFSSPLGVDCFMKRSSFIYYTKDALRASHERIEDFAHREGLDAHARSIAVRFEDEDHE